MITAAKNITMASLLVAGISLFHSGAGLSNSTPEWPELEQAHFTRIIGVTLPSTHSTYFQGRSRIGPKQVSPTTTLADLGIDTAPTPALQKYKVTSRSVNLRAGPTTQDAIIGNLPRDTVLTHLGVTDGDWLKVSVNKGDSVAWLHSSLVEPVTDTIVLAQN